MCEAEVMCPAFVCTDTKMGTVAGAVVVKPNYDSIFPYKGILLYIV